MNPVVVLSTVARDFDARPLARALVEARLAACVNIVPGLTSVYRWQGTVSEDGEQLLVIKTADARVDALREELLRIHPYDVPEFVVLAVEGIAPSYGEWLLESIAAVDEERDQSRRGQQ